MLRILAELILLPEDSALDNIIAKTSHHWRDFINNPEANNQDWMYAEQLEERLRKIEAR